MIRALTQGSCCRTEWNGWRGEKVAVWGTLLSHYYSRPSSFSLYCPHSSSWNCYKLMWSWSWPKTIIDFAGKKVWTSPSQWVLPRTFKLETKRAILSQWRKLKYVSLTRGGSHISSHERRQSSVREEWSGYIERIKNENWMERMLMMWTPTHIYPWGPASSPGWRRQPCASYPRGLGGHPVFLWILL